MSLRQLARCADPIAQPRKDATPRWVSERIESSLSVDHRFPRAGHLGYWVFVYNAKRDGSGTPNLTVRTEVLRDGRIILTMGPVVNNTFSRYIGSPSKDDAVRSGRLQVGTSYQLCCVQALGYWAAREPEDENQTEPA